MAVPISQTGNKRQEQRAGSFSTSWKLASCLTVPGVSVTPMSTRGLKGVAQPSSFQMLPACPERRDSPGC